MTYLTILEKLKVLLNVLLDYKLILICTIALILLTLLYLVKILSKKKYILSVIISFILTFAISIISNYKILTTTFDNFTTIFMRGIYFPSIYVYIITLVLVLIVFIISILSIKLPKTYKIINTITFILNNIFLVIVLNIIAKNKIDIFSVNSLYTNTNLVVILELNMSIIILWILSLTVVYLTNAITLRLTTKKKVKVEKEEIPTIKELAQDNEVLNTPVPAVEMPLVIETSVQETTRNIEIPQVIEEPVQAAPTVTFNDILNGKVEAVYYDNKVNNIEYTITNPAEDYEKKYQASKNSNIVFQDILKSEPEVITIKPKKEIIEPKLELEEYTKIEKAKNVKNRLSENTVSLDSLLEKTSPKEEIPEIKDNHTLEDYKLMINMLKDIKNITRNNNISIEDAINISLISNHSIEDCIKFRELLESSLN